jgi:hypothetical protein
MIPKSFYHFCIRAQSVLKSPRMSSEGPSALAPIPKPVLQPSPIKVDFYSLISHSATIMPRGEGSVLSNNPIDADLDR